MNAIAIREEEIMEGAGVVETVFPSLQNL